MGPAPAASGKYVLNGRWRTTIHFVARSAAKATTATTQNVR